MMPDREKVLKGLKCCTARNGICQYKQEPICPYVERCQKGDYAALQRDALTLLKKQDSELSYRKAKTITHEATRLDAATCPSCGNVVGETKMWGEHKVFIQWKYCIICGQKLDWEDQSERG